MDTLGTRRDFCLTACHALSLAVIAATLQSCGGGGSPIGPSGGFGTMLVARNDATSVSESVFQCPCHGSRFSPANGSVLRGPATAPLRRFNASLASGVVSITA